MHAQNGLCFALRFGFDNALAIQPRPQPPVRMGHGDRIVMAHVIQLCRDRSKQRVQPCPGQRRANKHALSPLRLTVDLQPGRFIQLVSLVP